MPNIQSIIDESASIVETIELFGFRNPRLLLMVDPDDRNELHFLVNIADDSAIGMEGSLALELQNKLNCIVFIDRDKDLKDYHIDKIYQLLDDNEAILSSFKGVNFKQRNEEYASKTEDDFHKSALALIKQGLLQKKRPYSSFAAQQEPTIVQETKSATKSHDDKEDKKCKPIDTRNGVHVNGNGLKPS